MPNTNVALTASVGDAVPGSGLRINEFMASNLDAHMDEYGEFDDWIELYNRGEQIQFFPG